MSHHVLDDFDSKIPNLALMKVSAWAKAKGDTVSLGVGSKVPDEIWLSCLFTWNRAKAEQSIQNLRQWFPNAKIHFGGTGFDWGKPLNDPSRIELPEEIEGMIPDYTLYGDDRAIGFCQRGCDRECQFCDVWRKEGKIKSNRYQRIIDWVPSNMSKVLLLDNDIALFEDWKHDQIINDCRETGRKLSITQGYDIRCVTPERAKLLAENKPYDLKFKRHCLYFAWDYLGIEQAVRKGIQMLLDAGFKGSELFCYTIVGFESEYYKPSMADYLYRYKVLWEEYGVYPFVMIFNNRRDAPELRAFARWINRRVHKSVSWEDYRGNPDFQKDEEYDIGEQMELA